MTHELYISVYEAAAALLCSPQYIRQLLRSGELEGTKLGDTWIVLTESVENFTRSTKAGKNVVHDQPGEYSPQKGHLRGLSFFSGAMGLDIGLERAGIDVLLACEFDKSSRQTILANHPNVALIGDILDYSPEDVIHFAGLKSFSEVDIIVGGPPCQAFSTAGKRMGFEDNRGNVFLKYLQLIETIRPKYAVIENVRGLLSSAMTIEDDFLHTIPFSIQGQAGSSLFYVKRRLERAGYRITFNLYNTANFGTPQIRERVVMIGTLADTSVPYLTPTHAQKSGANLAPWRTFRQAVEGLDPEQHTYVKFPEKRLKYIQMLEPGQNWRDLPEAIQPQAMGNSYHLGGGKTGFYRRLAWDKPAPTLVTHPAMPATELAHPVEDRPLSVQEYKRIQEFPDDWIICGKLTDQYRQIGNAVPSSLGYAIGKAIINHSKGKSIRSVDGFSFSRYRNTSEFEWEKEFLLRLKAIKKAPVGEQLALSLF